MQNQSMRLNPSRQIDIAHIARVNNTTFSENEIIAVNDMLLSPGLHQITVRNKKVGREIVDIFLSLLNQYHYIYWLSLDETVPAGTIHIYEHLKKYGALHDPAHMHEFMCCQFDPHFLVIEQTHRLQEQTWYDQFHMRLHEAHIFDAIPVLHMSFQEE